MDLWCVIQLIRHTRNLTFMEIKELSRVMSLSSPTSAKKQKRLAVILAGGDGSRLRSLTRSIAGDDRPKQFCSIMGERTLLDATRDRVGLGIARENTYFSLTSKHEQYYKAALWDTRPSQRIVQPENKGTAPAILYSLMRLAAVEPDGVVAFFPSDHYFANDDAFMRNVESAFKAVEVAPSAVLLLGIEPDKPETAYGWIEPAGSLFGGEPNSISRVNRFWEKPSSVAAKKLMASGSLWNSFVMVGRIDAFLKMIARQLPDMFRMFNSSRNMLGTSHETALIRSIYSWLEETNFSSEVLEKAAEDLMVIRVGNVGWCDWGEPQRVLGTLSNLGIRPAWAQAFAS